MFAVWDIGFLDSANYITQRPGARSIRPFVVFCRDLPLFSPSPAPLPPLFSFIISPMAVLKVCLILNKAKGWCLQ